MPMWDNQLTLIRYSELILATYWCICNKEVSSDALELQLCFLEILSVSSISEQYFVRCFLKRNRALEVKFLLAKLMEVVGGGNKVHVFW